MRQCCHIEPDKQPAIAGKRYVDLFGGFLSDESGGEVLEYALVAGLIIIAAIGAISTVGTKVLGRWNSLKNSM